MFLSFNYTFNRKFRLPLSIQKQRKGHFSGVYYHENRFLVGGKLASRARPGEKKGGGWWEVWMVGEIATFPVRRIPTFTSSRAMNPNDNIYNIHIYI